MLKVVLSLLFVVAGSVGAEEKTCTVKGMHCEDCVSSVKEKVCAGDLYAECEVKVTDKAKKVGEIHVKTKDAKAKIDEKKLAAVVSETAYSLEKCKSGKTSM